MPAYTEGIFFDRDYSWLTFNRRVLELAAADYVPLAERVKFLSIVSSNLDEFFRVRIPVVTASLPDDDPDVETPLAAAVRAYIHEMQEFFGQTLREGILPELARHGLHLRYGDAVLPAHEAALRDFFFTQVLTFLQPRPLADTTPQSLQNNALYLFVTFGTTDAHAVVNVPSGRVPRFFSVADEQGDYVYFLEDIIRHFLGYCFPNRAVEGCYSFKINRDAEFTFDELSPDFLTALEKSLAQRERGVLSRFLYDARLPEAYLPALAETFELDTDEFVPGGRYHSLSDLSDLTDWLGDDALFYPPWPPAPPAWRAPEVPLLDDLWRQGAALIFPPFHAYDPVLQFFNEAANDPDVTEVCVTLYRVATDSRIAHALSTAARNGKRVVVCVELKARFDEANNIRWARQMEKAGVILVYSIPKMKVHAKAALVKRRRGLRWEYFGLISTGNLNETTARFYTDIVYFTTRPEVTRELELLFNYLQHRLPPEESPPLAFNHLLVSRFNMLDRFVALIDHEIAAVRRGERGRIDVKVNNLQEESLIRKVVAAAEAGVEVRLIVRSICCLRPDVHPNLKVVRIVGRFLEHPRCWLFHHGGTERVFLGSADWMNRNLHSRIEVVSEVTEPSLKAQVRALFEAQWAPNTDAVAPDADQRNVPLAPDAPEGAQERFYRLTQRWATGQE